MNCIDDVADDVGTKALRLGCSKITILKPVLVSFMIAKFHVAREKVKFILNVGCDAISNKVPTGSVGKQVKDSVECWRKGLWICKNVLPQLMKLRNASNVLQQTYKVPTERDYILKSFTYETDDEFDFFVPQRY